MHFDESFWVAVATALFVIVVFKPAKKAMLSIIDKRILDIKTEIDDAKKLKEEAQELLAEAKKRLSESEEGSKAILKHAREEADNIISATKVKLSKDLETRKKISIQKIKSMEDNASKEIKKNISSMTILAAQTIAEQNIDDKAYDSLLDKSVEKISKTLH